MAHPTLQDQAGHLHVPKTMVIGTHVLKGGSFFSSKSPWYMYILQHATPEQKRLLGLGIGSKLPDFTVDVSGGNKTPEQPTGGGSAAGLALPMPGVPQGQETSQPPGERGTIHIGAVDIRGDEEVPKGSPLYWYVVRQAKPDQLAKLGIEPEQRPVPSQEEEAANYLKKKKAFEKFPIGQVPATPMIDSITGGEKVLQFTSEEHPVHVNPRQVTDYFREIMYDAMAALPHDVQLAIAGIKTHPAILVNRLQQKLDRGDPFKNEANETYVYSLYLALKKAFRVLRVGKPFVGYRALSRQVVQEMFDRDEIRGSEIIEDGYSNMSLCVLTAARELHSDDVGMILKLIVSGDEPAIYTDLMKEKGECEIILYPGQRYNMIDALPTFLPLNGRFVPVYTALVD